MTKPALLPLIVACALGFHFLHDSSAAQPDSKCYFGIRVVDAETSRGVPMVELETVNRIRYFTDSSGWAAIDELAFMDREVFFYVRSHGYEFPKDGFGFAGTRIKVSAGGRKTIQIRRQNIAERLYRITGAGIYRDSQLLGEHVPKLASTYPQGDVLGQDSAFTVRYRDKLFWFWGDTSRMSYPLGQFWMSGATLQIPADEMIDVEDGIDLKYFVDKEGFSKPMAKLGVSEGVIWADGFLTLRDATGDEKLLCHYAQMASLEKMISHGLAIYNDAKEEFELLAKLDGIPPERYPAQAHPFRHIVDDIEYYYFGEPCPMFAFEQILTTT
jgi:hypothetical protein